MERRQFEDSLDLSFEQYGQNDHIDGRSFAERGADLDVVRRDLRQEDALLFECRLSDQAFTGTNA